jgi:hypothetical protein
MRGFYHHSANSCRQFERLLPNGCRAFPHVVQAGDVLETGIGTGPNLKVSPAETRLVGTHVSPAVVAIARRRACGPGES